MNKGVKPPGTTTVYVDHVDFSNGSRITVELEPREHGVVIGVKDVRGQALGEVYIENLRRKELEGQVRVYTLKGAKPKGPDNCTTLL